MRHVYWDEWTTPRAIAAITWLAFTLMAGTFVFFVAGWESATVLGEAPTTDELRNSAALTLFAAALLGGGPFGIGMVRRTRGPKIAGVVLFVPAALAAVYYFVKSFT